MAKAKTIEPIEMQHGTITDLPLDLIDFDPTQPRKDFDQDYINELAADIKKEGVMQTITVRPNPDVAGRYYVVFGECRTRGSRLAGKATIPAVPATEAQIADAMTRAIHQVKENHNRRGLNAIELALFLRRLRDEFKVKSHKKIEATLKEHGINNMSESYISNLIRLADLPEWAQDLTREGKLTAAHGKYLLQAVASEPVMDYLRQKFQAGADMSVRDLQQEIADAFDEYHINLNSFAQTPFDYATACKGCQKMRKISGNETQEGSTYCLDGDCHEEKRKASQEANRKAAAERAASEGEGGGEDEYTAPTLCADGSVDADLEANEDVDWIYLNNTGFDTAACATCEHRHMVKSGDNELGNACFQPGFQCHRDKRNAVSEARRDANERENKIAAWRNDAIVERCADDQAAQQAILSYAALVAGHSAYLARQTARERTGLGTMRQLIASDINEVAHGTFPELLGALDDTAMMQLAQHLGISISDYSNDPADREIWNSMVADAGGADEEEQAKEAA